MKAHTHIKQSLLKTCFIRFFSYSSHLWSACCFICWVILEMCIFIHSFSLTAVYVRSERNLYITWVWTSTGQCHVILIEIEITMHTIILLCVKLAIQSTCATGGLPDKSPEQMEDGWKLSLLKPWSSEDVWLSTFITIYGGFMWQYRPYNIDGPGGPW